ncbi:MULTISPECIES: amidohydrolase [Mesonia]|uniref:2-oxoglutaramate amidase n=1 Tax=Mesonia oceanica TaxID=2687242 RepID=A0AC61Y3T1_9FLAO|nr:MULTISPECIES: amidohydrolase [Mesonia]MAN26887.1 amidohydrolase [Mesonia sp.]MAQ41701.1 amidohydrolase [Mesonia sp.]MBJ96559.1 amidohydrolase [Flavobacteriaceae bacterium]VVU99115.1 2-oxoglutaramate amidase [Mesonia oceanica]|tara:strand:+ start:713 stop:1489 length:777 start_codon:yes stop_codon:yes gene_type:complete
MEKLSVTIIQADLHWENAELNREMFSKKINELSLSTDLIVLPEMFTTGFSMNAENLAEETNGSSLAWLQQQAKKFEVALTGSVIITENNNYYNRLFFVFPDGSFKTYDKKHLFTLADEQNTYSAGKERLLVEYKGWKICPLICYDLRFPVWSRNTEDFDLLLYVANWPKKRTQAWDALLKARAIENMCYVAGVNRVGFDGNSHEYSGHSAIYDMLGKQISTLNHEVVFSETIQLSKQELNETRKRFAFLNDKDEFTLK